VGGLRLGWGAGKKLKARKSLEKRAESHLSAARFVGQAFSYFIRFYPSEHASRFFD